MMLPERDVLFLFAFVPPTLDDEIREGMALHDLRGRMIEPERRHITLFGFGPPSQTVVGRIERAMDALQPRLRPFGVIFEFLVVGAKQSLLLPAADKTLEGLKRTSDQCRIAFAEQGLSPPISRSSKPHVTVSYDGGIDGGTQPVYPVSWLVRDVALVVSHQNRHRHEVLRRWRLDAAPAGRSCQ
jgi:2'-5' RNA ligase